MSRMTIEKQQFEALQDIYQVCEGRSEKGEKIARIRKFDVMGVDSVLYVTVEIEPLDNGERERLSGVVIEYEFIVIESGLKFINKNGKVKPVTQLCLKDIERGALWRIRSEDNGRNG